MASQLASIVGRRILKENVANRFGYEDPYFEEVPASRLGRAFGKKTRKRRKAIPPGLSQNDARILTRVKRRAYQLDYSLFNLCGIRFGWGSVVGLFPLAGDGVDAALAMMVARDCQNIDGGLPTHIQTKMWINIIIDFFIGLVPFVGDIADAIFKANTRNAVLLEQHLRDKARKADKTRAKNENRSQRDNQHVDPSLPEEFDRYEEGVISDPPGYTQEPVLEPVPQIRDSDAREHSNPGPVSGPRSGGRESGWFGGWRRTPRDPEAGDGSNRR